MNFCSFHQQSGPILLLVYDYAVQQIISNHCMQISSNIISTNKPLSYIDILLNILISSV